MAGARAFMRLLQRAAGLRPAAPSSRMNVEEIEPRILHSADLAGFMAIASNDTSAAAVEMRVVETPVSQTQSSREERRHELVVVDSAVADYQQLVDDILASAGEDRQVDVIVLRPGDGIMRITDALEGRSDIDALHIVSHGSDGAVFLGRDRLDLATLTARQAEIGRWGAALDPDADILIYGCDVAQTASGQAMLQQLAAVTGADVAASTDRTGSAQLGGDWSFEYSQGSVETQLIVSRAAQLSWDGVLDAATLTAAKDTYIVSGSTNNYGASTTLELDRSGGSLGSQRALLQFDLSTIPAGSSINSATLQLEAGAVSAATNVAVHEVVESWSEGAGAGTADAANFSERAAGTTWTTTGGTFAASASATTNVAAAGLQTWNITALVQAWVSGGKANNGVILGSPDTGSDTVTFGSRESATLAAPRLVIDYTPQQAPVLDSTRSPALAAITEDAAAPAGAVGTLVSSLVDYATPAGQVDNVTDVNSATQQPGIAVTSANTANGTWWYTTNGGGTWNALGAVTDGNARLLAADANTRLYFTPAADYNGSMSDAITFRAWDGTSGTAGGLADTTTNGGTTAFSAATDTASLDVTALNDAPRVSGPGFQTTAAGAALTFSAANSNAISVSDSDAGASSLRVTLSSTNGTLTLSGTTGLAFTAGDGTTDAAMTFTGTVANINAALNGLRYTPTGGYNGIAHVNIDADDQGNTGAGGAATSTADVVIGVGSYTNYAPVLSGAVAVGSISEDAASNAGTAVSVLIAGHITDADAGAASGIAVTAVDNTNGTWQYSTNGGTSWTSFSGLSASSALLLDAASKVRFVANADWNGTVANGITFRAWDQTSGVVGETVNTAADPRSVADNFDVAAYTNNTGSENWSAAWVDSDGSFTSGQIKISGSRLSFDGGSSGSSTIYRQADLQNTTGARLKFAYANSAMSPGLWTLQISANGGTSYTSIANSDGLTGSGNVDIDISTYASANTRVRFVVQGNAGVLGIGAGGSFTVNDLSITYTRTLNGGTTAFSSATASSAITVTAVNDEPAGTDKTIGILEDTARVLTISDFGLSDPRDSHALKAVKVTTLPAAGALTLNGVAVSAGDFVSAADIAANLLVYTPPANTAGSASFTFQVQDTGGTADGGIDVDATPNTLTFNITSVADAPTGASKTIAAVEDTPYVFAASDFGFGDAADSDTFTSVQITTVPAAGALRLNGVAVTAGQTVSVADIAANRLVFTPAANANGAAYASFGFKVIDNGSTANGGVNIDPVARTMTMNVAAVNDAPAGASNTVTTLEDVAYTFRTADFSFSDALDGNAMQSVVIAGLPTAGTLRLNGVAVSAGQTVLAVDIAANRLVFSPAANVNGTAYSTFTFQVRDNGGTANSGVDLDPTARTMTINVTAVQDAPTLTGATNLASISEDATGNAGTLVSALIAGNVADADAGALSGIAVIGVDNSNGTWQYSTNAGSTWTNFGSPSAGTARLLASDAKVRFVPDANWNGTVANGLTFRAWDRTTGVNGGTAPTIANPTYRDNFSSVSYANNDGTATWSGNWVDDDGSPSGGRITINGGWLEIRSNNSGSIYREVDLSGATSAHLSFTFNSTISGNDTSVVTIYASSNGGASYSSIGTFSKSSLTGFGTASGDISSFISANTRIKFEVTTTESPAETISIGSLVISTTAAGNGGGTAFSSATATSGITVNAIGDAPSGASRTVTTAEDVPYVFDAAAFGFSDAVDAAANGGANSFAAVKVSALPAAGTLTLNGVAVTAGQVVAIGDITVGKLVFTPAANASGASYASFQFQVQDDGSTANGGVNLDPTARTMTINVTARNDAPVGTDTTKTVLEDGSYVFSASSFGFTDPSDAAPNALHSVRIAALPTAGTLTLNGAAVSAGQFVSAADIADGKLVYSPAANANGASYSSFTFQVRDDGGTANGGTDLDTVARTFTFNVTSVNDAPVGTNNTVTVLEDGTHAFTTAEFGFTDPQDGVPNTLAAVRIVTGPAAGSLRLNGVAVTNGQLVSAADIAGGKLVYAPPANANGTGYASFTFRVQDSGGTANGGVDFDPTARTMRIDVTSVNDAPSGSDVAVGTTENVPFVFSAAAFGFTDSRDGDELFAVRIDTLPSVGALTLSGVAVTAGQDVSAADIAGGKLVYTPVANQSGAGYASFRFRVQDDGGTANGGVDSDATFNTLTIDVGPINHAPVGTDATVAMDEDATFVFSRATFGFSDANDVLLNNFHSVRITTLPAAGTLTLNGAAVTAGQFVSVADLDAGRLVYRPAVDGNGAGYAEFTFQVKDDGGTANGGVDLDATGNTIRFDVTAVNDAPTGADATVTTLEDTPYVFDVTAFGYADARDGGLHNLFAVRIDSLPARGSLTLDGVAIAAGQSIDVADIAAGKLVYAPAADGNGAAYASFTFRVQDDGGVALGGADLDSVARTVRIDVTAINDAPTGQNRTVTAREDTPYVFDASAFGFRDDIDGGAHTLAAVKIASLPVNGALTLNGVAVVRDQLVSAADIAAGRLVYTPVGDRNGAAYASFTFQVQDDGGTANAGVNLDATARTLTIDVAAVNDAPSGTSATFTLLEDTPYTLSAASFGFSDAIDGHGLASVKITSIPTAGTLTLNGAAVNAGRFVSAADIAAGKLVYTPGANAHGAGYASFTFQVRDDGGTSNGGTNLDATARTLTFDVTAVNDAPAGADKTVVAVEDTPYVFATSAFGFTDAADGGAHGFSAVKIGAIAGGGSLLLDGVAVSANQWIAASDIAAGKLVFVPGANGNGAAYASFTFQVKDDGGIAGGGVDVDATPRTMTIDVTPVNDAPTGTSATVTIREDSTLQLDLAAFGFVDSADGDALKAVTITALPAAGTLTLDGVAVIAGQSIDAADIAAGKLVFAPATDASGNAYATIAFRVQDDGGGADTDVEARTLTVNVLAVNDAPAGADATLQAFEDTPLVFGSAAFGFTDAVEGNAFLGVRISSLPGAGVLALDGVAVRAGQVVSAADIAAGKLVFNPAANTSGAAYASFTFQVQDDGGVDDGGADFDAVARTLIVDVAELNDAPEGRDVARTFAQDTSYTVRTSAFSFRDSADTPSHAFAGIEVATLPRAGLLRLDGAALAAGDFVSASDIASGRLVYSPSAGGAGTAYASFGFRVVDDGPSGGGSVNTDAHVHSFTFNVTPKPVPVMVTETPVIAPVVTPPAVATQPTVQTMPGGTSGSSTTSSSTSTSSTGTSSSGEKSSSTSTATGSTASTQSASKTVEQGAAQRAAAEAAATGATSGAAAGGSGGGGAAAAQVAGGVNDVRPVEIAAQGAAGGVQRLDSQVRSDARNLGPVLNVATDAPLLLAQIQMGDAVSDLGKAFGMLQSSSSSAAANAAVEQRQLMQQLDEVRDTLREQTKLEASTVAASASAAVSLSVGYVVWLLRGGVLVSTFLSAMPAWRLVDPLPILENLDDEDGEDDDSLESLVARTNVAAGDDEQRPATGGVLQVEAV